MRKQTIIITLDPSLARQVQRFLTAGGHGYASLDEFVSLALFNQLNAEGASLDRFRSGGPGGNRPDHYPPSLVPRLLARPETKPELELAAPPQPSADTLFVLTNRLSPIKIAARVLANLASDGEWPFVQRFQETAAETARDLGRRLRQEDRAAKHTGRKRRSIGYPIGDDVDASAGRFISSFTMSADGGEASGPMVLFGLATSEGDRAALTEAGWRLAEAPSPLTDGAPGLTLSEDEIVILRRQLMTAPAELAVVQEFIELVTRAAGSQSRLDEELAIRHPEWTANFAVAHRSALIGRLCELGFVDVTGRGPNAALELLPAVRELEELRN